MAIMNRRQQARNERALQDLIHNAPGNDRCADCQARNPGARYPRPDKTLARLLTLVFRLGKLECECPVSYICISRRRRQASVLTKIIRVLAGNLPLHALRRDTSEAGHAHLKGQIPQHGHLDQ